MTEQKSETRNGSPLSARGFTKEQLVASAKYAGQQDLLGALLQNGRCYTEKEIGDTISGFMERKVN